MTKNQKLTAGIGATALAAVVAWLAFAIFGVHTLFVDNTVDEANPFASPSLVTTIETDPPDDLAMTDDVAALDSTEAAEPAEALTTEAVDNEVVDAQALTEAVDDAVAAEATAIEPTTAADPAEPVVRTLATGSIIDHDHSGDGTVNVLTDGTQSFLRFEDDFAVDNGPDLNVYLVRGATADGDPDLFDDDFIDLGDLKGNIGAQNYELPPGIDVSEYDTVVIWCVRFGVAFNAAALA